jgi:hypothetical protein
VNVIQDVGFCALHAHPVPAVTVTVPVFADALTDALVGEML